MSEKRFLTIISFSALIGLYVVMTMPKNIFYVSLALFVTFIIFHRATVNRYTAEMSIALVGVLLSFAYFNFYNDKINTYFQKTIDRDVIRNGTIVSQSKTDYGSREYTVKLNSLNGEKINNFSVKVYVDDVFYTGDKIEMYGKLEKFSPKSNYLINYSNSIFANFEPYKINIRTPKMGFYKFFGDLRYSLFYRMGNLYDDYTLPVAAAMGIGNKTKLNDTLLNKFRDVGMSHTLVVSGLHIGFIVLAFEMLMKNIPINKRIKNLFLTLFIFIFMGIVGFTPSSVRAGILAISILFGKTFFLEIDNYTILGITVLLTILSNPYKAVNAGLLLSYAAYFGVVYAVDFSANRNFGNIKTSICISVFAMCFTLPITSMLKMNINIFAPIFNVLSAPIIFVVCVLSLFTVIFDFIPILNILSNIILVPLNEYCIKLLIIFVNFCSEKFKFGNFDLSDFEVKLMIFFVTVITVIIFMQLKNKTICKIIVSVSCLVVFLCYNYLNKDVVTVQVFDGISQPFYRVEKNNKEYIVLTENFKEKEFISRLDGENISDFDKIIYCGMDQFNMYFINNPNIQIVCENGVYKNEIFDIHSYISDNDMRYMMNIDGVKFGFSHKEAIMDSPKADFYFLGNDVPQNINSDNIYYFYPLEKSNQYVKDLYDMTELYDKITVKVKDGKYYIVKDVKNFDNRIQN